MLSKIRCLIITYWVISISKRTMIHIAITTIDLKQWYLRTITLPKVGILYLYLMMDETTIKNMMTAMPFVHNLLIKTKITF